MPSPASSARSRVEMSATKPSTCIIMSAASNPGMAPSGVAEIPSGPHPFCRDSSLTSHAVKELAVVTPIRRPLRSSTDLIAPSGRTIRAMSSGGPAMAATALIGTPFTIPDISGLEPSPISTKSAVSACCSLPPPP